MRIHRTRGESTQYAGNTDAVSNFDLLSDLSNLLPSGRELAVEQPSSG